MIFTYKLSLEIEINYRFIIPTFVFIYISKNMILCKKTAPWSLRTAFTFKNTLKIE